MVSLTVHGTSKQMLSSPRKKVKYAETAGDYVAILCHIIALYIPIVDSLIISTLI